jgi:uncharacterized RDD family membrane protein YckC
MALPGLNLDAAPWPPDPLSQPQWYRGVTLSRVFAYMIDACIIFLILVLMHFTLGILTIASLGLLFPLHLLVLPLAIAILYHSLTMSSSASATFGMRMMGLRVYTERGEAPGLPQTLLHSSLFYITIGFGGWLLLFALFNSRRRTLHDFLSGMMVLRAC